MKKIFFVFLLIFTLFRSQTSWACDLLSIEIGSDKKTIENIFGSIDTEEMADSANQLKGENSSSRSNELEGVGGPVTVLVSEKNAFTTS